MVVPGATEPLLQSDWNFDSQNVMRPVLTLFFSLTMAVAVLAQDKPRVFITDSHSWEIAGGFGATGEAASGAIRGGARPQTAEIMHTFGQRCPEVIITNMKEKADYAVVLDHEGGKGLVRRDNKIVVFDRNGDMMFSRSTRSLGNAVKDACLAIVKASGKRAEPSR